MKKSKKFFIIALLAICIGTYGYESYITSPRFIEQQAIDAKDPSRCEKLPISAGWVGGAGFPRASCYLGSITSIGDISMCGKYFDSANDPSWFNLCQLQLATNKKDASLCGINNACVAEVAKSSKDVSMCNLIGIDKLQFPNWPRSRCISEANWAIKLNK